MLGAVVSVGTPEGARQRSRQATTSVPVLGASFGAFAGGSPTLTAAAHPRRGESQAVSEVRPRRHRRALRPSPRGDWTSRGRSPRRPGSVECSREQMNCRQTPDGAQGQHESGLPRGLEIHGTLASTLGGPGLRPSSDDGSASLVRSALPGGRAGSPSGLARTRIRRIRRLISQRERGPPCRSPLFRPSTDLGSGRQTRVAVLSLSLLPHRGAQAGGGRSMVVRSSPICKSTSALRPRTLRRRHAATLRGLLGP